MRLRLCPVPAEREVKISRPRSIYQGEDLWPGFTRWCLWRHGNHALYLIFGVVGAGWLIVQGRGWEVLFGVCSSFFSPFAFFATLVADGVLVEAIAGWAGRRAGKWMETMIVVAHFAFQLFAIAAWTTCVYWLFTVRRVGPGYAGGVLWAFFVVLRPVYYIGREDPLDDLPNQSAMMLCWVVFAVLLAAHVFLDFSVADSLPLIATAAASTILCVCGILFGRPEMHGRPVSLCLGLGRLGISDPQAPAPVDFPPIEDLLKHAKGISRATLEERRKRAKTDRPSESQHAPSNPQSEINNQRSDAPPAAPIETTTAADMMALCDSIVGSTAKLFTDRHLRDALQVEELYAFAMATVTEVYTLGQGSAAKATPALDGFHDFMASRIEGRFLQGGRGSLDDATINRLMDHFFELLRMRYPEYQKVFRNDVLRKDQTWFGLSGLVVQRVFDNRLTDEQKATLLAPLALHLAVTIVSSMDVLFPPKTRGQEESLPADFTPIERLLKFDGEPDMPAWTYGEAASRALFPESRRRRTAEPPAPPSNAQSGINNQKSDAPPAAPKQ